MKEFNKNKLEKILIRGILFTLLIFLLSKVSFIFIPLIIILKTVAVPIVLSGVLFYLLSPIRDKIMKWFKVNKIVSIIIIYLMMVVLLVSAYFVVWPVMKEQVGEFTVEFPTIAKEMKEEIYKLEEDGKIHLITDYMKIDEIFVKVDEFIHNVVIEGSKEIFTYLGKLSSFIIYMIIVPFILFYMLKDGEKLGDSIVKFLKKSYRGETKKILFEMNDQLRSYVIGQITVYLVVGILNLIGFYILGINYALLLAVMFVVINCVPVIGVFFAATPAVIVAFLDSPILALKVIILVTIVNQIDTHLLSPQIMGKKLNVHPLTIIILMLVAGSFLGVLGLIFALPVYVLIKVLALNLQRVRRVYMGYPEDDDVDDSIKVIEIEATFEEDKTDKTDKEDREINK